MTRLAASAARRFKKISRWAACVLLQRRLRRFVARAASAVEAPLFVKVGANDGVTGDPFGRSLLNDRRWKGLLVEPVPYCADRLEENYGDAQRFTIERIACGAEVGAAPLYFIPESASKIDGVRFLPGADQLGSFSRAHLEKHMHPDLAKHIESLEVRVEPLAETLARRSIEQVTLLHIDTEGHDLVVLRSLGLPAVTPLSIMIEHVHLSDDDYTTLVTLLVDNGYRVEDTGSDLFGVHESAPQAMRDGRPIGQPTNKQNAQAGQRGRLIVT